MGHTGTLGPSGPWKDVCVCVWGGIQPKFWQCSTLCLGSLPDLFFSTRLAKFRHSHGIEGDRTKIHKQP